ncbi:hypothetical protein [Mesorhizobium xinjiangense]|uniref:hypothetical protein n=1 Tax=Mesorhizobium xinjiangense TaxID=2678685 RepID=UPI0012ED38D6|nr:hypothetical protein [Mesorhizobium xinjiangense]
MPVRDREARSRSCLDATITLITHSRRRADREGLDAQGRGAKPQQQENSCANDEQQYGSRIHHSDHGAMS